MKKYTIIMLAGGGCVLAALIASLVLLDQPQKGEASVPEFVMPSQTASCTAEELTSSSDTAFSEPAVTATHAVTAAPADSSEAPEPASASEPDFQPDPVSETSAETASSSEPAKFSTVPTKNVETSAKPAASTTPQTSRSEAATPAETSTTAASSEPEVPELPQNVLVTSGDTQHSVTFTFDERRISFSGNYTGAAISDVQILRKRILSSDLTSSGSSFSGSLDVSGLAPGYYIIRVDLEDGSVMDYVFEMTSDGSAPLSWEELPADENLRAAASPLELPAEGVLLHVTSSGDPETARQVLQRIRELSDEICAGLTSDYDKARAISVWVSRNMYYDKDASESGVTDDMLTLEHVLEYHRSVCFGWSNLFSALCQAQGIWCANASGSVVTGSRCFMQTTVEDERSHSWNMVVIDGRQIWVDTVWNSTNSYTKRRYVDGTQDMQYFDISTAALSQDHRVARFEHRDYFGAI